MKIYLTTDTHFNHDKMVEYCDRPKNFEELIKKGLQSVLTENDILIHLGDVCFGNDKENNNWFGSLPCKKYLVRGNHDSKSIKYYSENGWDFVGDRIDLKVFGKKITLSHEPVSGDFDINIHGHFHNELPRILRKEWVVADEEYRNNHVVEKLTDKHKLLALELTNYKPVTLDKFLTPHQNN